MDLSHSNKECFSAEEMYLLVCKVQVYKKIYVYNEQKVCALCSSPIALKITVKYYNIDFRPDFVGLSGIHFPQLQDGLSAISTTWELDGKIVTVWHYQRCCVWCCFALRVILRLWAENRIDARPCLSNTTSIWWHYVVFIKRNQLNTWWLECK